MDDKNSADRGINKKRNIVIVAGAVVLLAVFVPSVLFFILSGSRKTEDPSSDKTLEEPVLPAYIEIPPLLINLNSPTGTRYLRLRLQLELESQADVPLAETAKPRIVDALQTYLRQVNAEELRGAAGTQKLQTDLLGLVSSVEHHFTVKHVLIQEMLVQ